MSEMIVPSAAPSVTEEDIEAVNAVLRSGVLANGPVVAALETEFSRYCGGGEAVAVANGTAALVLAGQALGLGQGDTVLVSAYTFAASANAFLALGCKVLAVDVDASTMNIDAEALRAALHAHPEASAAVIVDLFGSTAGTDEAIKVARHAGLRIVEDAAQAHGARGMTGARTGMRDADATTFSLYATKNMAAGEGGLIITRDAGVAARLRLLRNHGSIDTYRHEILGLNQRLPEVAAALARGQLARLDGANQRRRANAVRMTELVARIWGDRATTPAVPPAAAETHVFHQYTVRFPTAADRDDARTQLRAEGVDARHFYPYAVNSLPGVTASAVPVAEMLRDTTLSLPIHPGLTEEQWEHLEQALERSLHAEIAG